MSKMVQSLILASTMVITLGIGSCDDDDSGGSKVSYDPIWVTNITDNELASETTYDVGERITIWVHFDREVELVGSSHNSTLSLNIGGRKANASLSSAGDWDTKHNFSYVVRNGDSDSNGIQVTGMNIVGHLAITDREDNEMQGNPTFRPYTLSNVLVDAVE